MGRNIGSTEETIAWRPVQLAPYPNGLTRGYGAIEISKLKGHDPPTDYGTTEPETRGATGRV